MIRRILAIDDDENYLKSVKKILEMNCYEVKTISNPKNVLTLFEEFDFDAVLLDVRMPGLNGIQLFEILQSKNPLIPIIIVSGQSNIGVAVDFIKSGAYDFIEKPIEADRLLVALNNAIDKKDLLIEKQNILGELLEHNRIIGNSKETKQLLEQIDKVSKTNAKILITGETGVGKELVAWSLHHNSNRNSSSYVKINCAAIPPDLLESELFGHKKGSFTSAYEDKIGKFELANGGTLFLDEIGDMDLKLQSKILRVMEDNEIEKIGSNLPKKVDVRIITATNKDLSLLVESGKFREDLYHRINVIKIHVPALRERKDDILPLVYHYMNRFSVSYNKNVQKISRQGESILKNHHWAGNVRELKNVVEKLVIFNNDGDISVDQILHAIDSKILNSSSNDTNVNFRTARSNFERDFILKVLEQNDWKIIETAEALEIDRTNLFKKMRRYGIRKN